MNILKRNEGQGPVAMGTSRRSFIWKMGMGASATVASAAGMAKGEADTAGNPALQAALLLEEQSLRKLHRSFEQAMDAGLHEEVIGMFADDAEVVFNGGSFRRRQGISRLYRDNFLTGKTGRRMDPAPGFELAADQQRDSVEVAADRLSAKAEFTYSIQVGTPVESVTSLASMARLHGEGVQTWWEGGVYDISYRKKAADGRWQISRLEYITLSRADYRAGRSYAQSISVPRFSTRYPELQNGPDALV
jgi:hypothetical protein